MVIHLKVSMLVVSSVYGSIVVVLSTYFLLIMIKSLSLPDFSWEFVVGLLLIITF